LTISSLPISAEHRTEAQFLAGASAMLAAGWHRVRHCTRETTETHHVLETLTENRSSSNFVLYLPQCDSFF